VKTQLKPLHLSIGNRLMRSIWAVIWALLYRPSPRPLHAWRCMLLRLFGAKLGDKVHPYPSSRVWAPWNLEMGDHACLGDDVICYSVDKVRVGAHTTISQYSYLCTASHDYADLTMPLVTAPIVIGSRVWIAADVFVGPGVTIGDGTVVTARSSDSTPGDAGPRWAYRGADNRCRRRPACAASSAG
jgi:putative colanic acid biosynthesis acetyltransferase WcaF